MNQDRVAIVTGGSRGMGRDTIHRLSGLGYAVVVNYVHDQRTAESVVDAALEAHGTAVAIRADVSDVLDVERLFGQTIVSFGGIDAVIHGVRGHVSEAPLTEIAFDDFEVMCATNLRATFVVNRMAARQVRDGGAIVNLFSSVDASVLPRYGAYATTAAAVRTLTSALALELRERAISVNALSLGIERECVPSRIADVVAYLLSDEGHAVSGHVIAVG